MTSFSHYELLSEIGSGATAAVWKARDSTTQQIVALKIFFPEFSRNSFFRERSHREFLELKEVESTRILRPLDWVEHEGSCALALDYIQGETLEKMQTRLPYVLPELSAYIILEILRGLKEAHDRGWVHRDLKPANILIDLEKPGRILISDFGLARLAHQSLNHSLQGKIVGSPDFMSPELARGEGGDSRADLFSISALFYFLVTGTKPFQRENVLATLAAVLEGKFERVQLRNPRVSAELAAIIQKGLAKKASERFQGASEYIEVLEGYLKSTGLDPTVPVVAEWIKFPSEVTFDLLMKQSQFLKRSIENFIVQKDKDRAWAALEHLSKIAPESPDIDGWLKILRPRQNKQTFWTFKNAWALAFLLVLLGFGFWFYSLKEGPSSHLNVGSTDSAKSEAIEAKAIETKASTETKPAVSLVPLLPQAEPAQSKTSRAAAPLRGKRIAFDLPPNVKVFLDGKEILNPKVGLARPRVGLHQLRLEKPGANPIVQDIQVKPNEEVNIRAR